MQGIQIKIWISQEVRDTLRSIGRSGSTNQNLDSPGGLRYLAILRPIGEYKSKSAKARRSKVPSIRIDFGCSGSIFEPMVASQEVQSTLRPIGRNGNANQNKPKARRSQVPSIRTDGRIAGGLKYLRSESIGWSGPILEPMAASHWARSLWT